MILFIIFFCFFFDDEQQQLIHHSKMNTVQSIWFLSEMNAVHATRISNGFEPGYIRHLFIASFYFDLIISQFPIQFEVHFNFIVISDFLISHSHIANFDR